MTYRRKTTRDLRKFGVTMFVAFALIAALLWWRSLSGSEGLSGSESVSWWGNPSWWKYAGSLSAAFLLLAVLAPTLLRPVERAWMGFAGILGAVMTRVVLTVGFLIAVTPTALIMRIRKKDLLNLRFDPKADSYWEPVEPDGPSTRPTKPY